MPPLLALTIDVEWAPLSILEEMRGMLDARKIPATFFCTDEPALSRDGPHEYAIHPHFHGMEDWESVLAKMRALNPAATGIRAHFLHSDTRLVRLFPSRGFTYQSSLFAPGQPVAPFTRESGLWEIPIHYMDDLHFRCPEGYPAGYHADSIPSGQPLVVADFHPIPWFINAAEMADYDKAKPAYKDAAALAKLRRRGEGVGTMFERVLDAVKAGRWQPVTLSQVVEKLGKGESPQGRWPSA